MSGPTSEGHATVNLTALAEARAKMTPGDWSVLIGSACDPRDDEACGIASSQWRQTSRGRDEAVFRSDAYDECSHPIARADAQGIVATHNAADVLIEVARAAKTMQAGGWDFRSSEMDELLAALAKVSL